MNNKSPYAQALITCKQKVRFPSFLKTLHIQGEANQTYTLECFSFAESAYYVEMCKSAPDIFAPAQLIKS